MLLRNGRNSNRGSLSVSRLAVLFLMGTSLGCSCGEGLTIHQASKNGCSKLVAQMLDAETVVYPACVRRAYDDLRVWGYPSRSPTGEGPWC